MLNLNTDLFNKRAIPREASEFELGETMYYIVLIGGAITWQLSFIGGLGIILYTSSLFSGILTSVLLPFTEIAAVIVYHESFTGLKGMALALCLWGFTSYFYGEYKMMKDMNTKALEKIVDDDDDEPCTV
ncbi:Triose-phosphate transporter domain [Macleaya cordata]|uniref:Triose-phosphate transporter domain n=1 Tax=Macleaya cordata TaxID=56857 RepID=A0A200R2U6_MACCD|nr:Triose-phosphate transporter domain [Macleaya cordata]